MKIIEWFKKQNKFKKFFLLSLLPYTVMLIMSVYSAIFGYENFVSGENGLNAAWHWMNDHVFSPWLNGFNWIHLLFLIIVPYQFLYILKLRHIGKPFKLQTTGKTVAEVFFVLSLIPLIFILVFAIIAGLSEAGVNNSWFGVNMIYGIEAFWHTLWFGIAILSLFPIIPVCTIYQVVYVIVKIVEKKRRGD
jgi:hypothetical protein